MFGGSYKQTTPPIANPATQASASVQDASARAAAAAAAANGASGFSGTDKTGTSQQPPTGALKTLLGAGS